MSYEIQPQNQAVETAPELETTAAPESENTEAPEGYEGTSEVTEKVPDKTFTQEELEAALGKRLAIERRRWERDQVNRTEVPKPSNEPISSDQFESYEAYAEALAERKAYDLIRQREIQQQHTEIETAYADREEDARAKYDDFEQVAHNPHVPITEVMAETIKASEIGPDVAYWLGSNPKEADRISRLSPLQQAREIGKIEVKIASEPPAKKTTSAPAPITPVSARTSTNPSYDTTDPRSIKSMSTSEWIEADRQRQIKKIQSQNR